jgi:hypothetical protein
MDATHGLDRGFILLRLLRLSPLRMATKSAKGRWARTTLAVASIDAV